MKHAWLMVMALGAIACSGACSGSGTTGGTTPQATGVGATFTVSSVALASDCGDGQQAAASVALAGDIGASGKCAPNSDCGNSMCQQTSMQLELHATGTGAPAHVDITKIELIGPDGVVVGELTPRTGVQWTEGGTYEAWDGLLAAGQMLKVSYPLSAPDWDKVPGGRFSDQLFQVRVTAKVGDAAVTSSLATGVAVEPMIMT